MKRKCQRAVDLGRQKLNLLRQRYDAMRQQPADDDHVQELTLRTLKRLINQLIEEIARFEGHSAAG